LRDSVIHGALAELWHDLVGEELHGTHDLLMVHAAKGKITDKMYHLKNSRLKVHALPGCHNEGKWA
jgi:hypothetical protein